MREWRAPGTSRRAVLSGLIALSITLSIAAVLGGCAVVEPPQAQPSISVDIVQFRNDYAGRIVALSVRNDSDSAVEIISAEYRSPSFAEELRYPPNGREGATIPANGTRDLRVALPAVRCGQSDDPDSRVEIQTRTADGGTSEYSVAPGDPLGTIARIVAQECLAVSVESVLTIVPPAALRVEGTGLASRAWLDLLVEPSGAGEASLTLLSLHPTTLLDSPDGSGWPLDLTIDARDAALPLSIEIRPSRCDPHAVAEDKRGTVLSFEPTEGGRYEVPVSDVVRAEIYAFVAAVCGFPALSVP